MRSVSARSQSHRTACFSSLQRRLDGGRTSVGVWGHDKWISIRQSPSIIYFLLREGVLASIRHHFRNVSRLDHHDSGFRKTTHHEMHQETS